MINFDNLPQLTTPSVSVVPQPTQSNSTDTLSAQTVACIPMMEAGVAFVNQMQNNARVIGGYQKAGLLVREVTAATLSYTHILSGKITTTATTNVQLGRSERDPSKAALLRSGFSKTSLVSNWVSSDLSDQENLDAANALCAEYTAKPLAPNTDPHVILLPELCPYWWIRPTHDNMDWYGQQVRPLISAGTKYLILTYPGSVKAGSNTVNSFYRAGVAVKADPPVVYDQHLVQGVFGHVLLSSNTFRKSVSLIPIYSPRDLHTAQLLTYGWTLVESTPTIAVWKIGALEQTTCSELNAAVYKAANQVATEPAAEVVDHVETSQ